MSKVFKLILALPFGHLEHYLWFQEMLQFASVRFFVTRGNILVAMLALCHWMACALKLVNQGYLDNYEHDGLWSIYGVTVYWAMTTLTTVGYGDLTPTTDKERLFTIVAMVVGGAFYAVLVGSISSAVAQSDLNTTAFHERMDHVL